MLEVLLSRIKGAPDRAPLPSENWQIKPIYSPEEAIRQARDRLKIELAEINIRAPQVWSLEELT